MMNPDNTSQMIAYTNQQYEDTKRYHSSSADTLNELRKEVMDDLHMDAEEDDNIYDDDFEKMLEERLSKLDDLSRIEFYRLRTHRKNNGILSARDLDMLTLEAMEKSFAYKKDQ
ncbi:MAG: hypothetical protein PHX08_05395 [Lachnospiraceae bacterium]|nr:hypothetical protein [Lachnospiraceae bacterium]